MEVDRTTSPPSAASDRSSSLADKRPPRPPFSSGRPKRNDVPMPVSVWLVMALVVVSAADFIWLATRSVLRQAGIREVLEKQLAETSPNYPATDIEKTVLATIIGVAAISLLLVIGELWSASKLRRQKRGGRSVLTFLFVLHIPVLVVTRSLLDGGMLDEIGVLVQAGCLLAATMVARLPATTTWLKSRPALPAVLFAHPRSD